MAAWLVVFQKVHDSAWIENYVANVPAIVSKHGGSYLGVSHDVHLVENYLTTEGASTATNSVIFSFPSRRNIEDFMNSDEYQPHAASRRMGSNVDAYILDDVQTEFA